MIKIIKMCGVMVLTVTFFTDIIIGTLFNICKICFALFYGEPLREWVVNPIKQPYKIIKSAIFEIINM